MGSVLCTSNQDHDAKLATKNAPSNPDSKDDLAKSDSGKLDTAANKTVLDDTDVETDVKSKLDDSKQPLAICHPTDVSNNVSSTATLPLQSVDIVAKSTVANGDVKTSPQPQVVIRAGKVANQRLHRGFSSLADNAGMLDVQRRNIVHDLDLDEEVEVDAASGAKGGSSSSGGGNASLDDGTMENTFVLPNLLSYEAEFRDYIMKTLLEKSTQVCLENTGHLNWWTTRGLPLHLVPMATDGDGNCLLHAASLAMWGFHDRRLTLRTHLNSTMTEGRVCDAMYRRWRWQQTQSNLQLGLTLETDQWAAEWSNLLKLSSLTPKRDGSCTSPENGSAGEKSKGDNGGTDETAGGECSKVYESLEEFHVFVLAHVLRRPIIVIADTVLRNVDNEAIAPIPFGGIYLPVERHPTECYNSPLLLAYDAAHFSALVTCAGSSTENKSAEQSSPAAAAGNLLPLVDPAYSLLPLHFTVDPGQSFAWDEANEKTIAALEPTLRDRVRLLRQYLDVGVVSATLCSEAEGGNGGGAVANGKVNHAKPAATAASASQATKGSSVAKRLLRGVLNRSVSVEEEPIVSKKEGRKRPLSGLRRTISKRLTRLHLPGGKKKTAANNSEITDDKKMNTSEVIDTPPPAAAAAASLEIGEPSDEIVECLTSRRGDKLVCSRIEIKLPDYYDNMVDAFIRTHREAYEVSKSQKATNGVGSGNGDSAAAPSTLSGLRLSQNINASTPFANGSVAAIAVANDDDDVDAIIPTSCINDNCNGLGIAARCYLCDACYQRQRSEEIDATLGRNGKLSANSSDSAGDSSQQRLSALLNKSSRPGSVALDTAVPTTGGIEALLRKENGYYGSNGTASSLLSNGNRLLSNGGLLSSPSAQLLRPAFSGPSDVEKSLSSLLSSESNSSGAKLSKSYDAAALKDAHTLQYGSNSSAECDRLASTRRDMQFMTLVSVGRDMCEPPLRAEFERLHLSVSGAGGRDSVIGKADVTLRNGSALSAYTKS